MVMTENIAHLKRAIKAKNYQFHLQWEREGKGLSDYNEWKKSRSLRAIQHRPPKKQEKKQDPNPTGVGCHILMFDIISQEV